jgi:hypothetical protein
LAQPQPAPLHPPPLLSGDLVNALKKNNCVAALKLINPLITSNDEQAIARSLDLDLTLESGAPDGKKDNLSDLQPLLQNMTH